MIAELIENENGQDTTELLPSRGSFTESQARGETDIQISTAHRFPRSVKSFRQKALSLATLDEETAASCFYSLSRGNKPIEGPSARLAEIVAVSWGNLRSQANVVDVDDKWVTARGVCWDLEANVAVSVEVRRRITDKNGRRYNDDMIGVTSNAACAIALRNAVFKVVPMAMCKPIYEAARKVAIGDAQTLSARRAKMVDHFGKMGVKPEQICAKVERASIDDITLDDLGTLIGLATAIKDGDTTIDETFADPTKAASGNGHGAEPPKSNSEQLAAKLKASKPAAKTETQAEPETVTDTSDAQEPPADDSNNDEPPQTSARSPLAPGEQEEPDEWYSRIRAEIPNLQTVGAAKSLKELVESQKRYITEDQLGTLVRLIVRRRDEIQKAQKDGNLMA